MSAKQDADVDRIASMLHMPFWRYRSYGNLPVRRSLSPAPLPDAQVPPAGTPAPEPPAPAASLPLAAATAETPPLMAQLAPVPARPPAGGPPPYLQAVPPAVPLPPPASQAVSPPAALPLLIRQGLAALSAPPTAPTEHRRAPAGGPALLAQLHASPPPAQGGLLAALGTGHAIPAPPETAVPAPPRAMPNGTLELLRGLRQPGQA